MFGERNGNEKVLAISHISSLMSLTDEKGMRTMRGITMKIMARKSQGKSMEMSGKSMGISWEWSGE